MKVVLKAEPERVLVIYVGNDFPFVVASTPDRTCKVGELISDWYWGTYFKTIEEALAFFNKGGVKHE